MSHFKDRYAQLGDMSETKFKQWAEEKQIEYERYGFDRPQIGNFWKIPIFIRKTPDFICKGKTHFFVEAKGTGKDTYVKIKDEDMTQLLAWNEYLPAWVFIYDSYRKQISFIDVKSLALCCDQSETANFDDGPLYYKIAKTLLVWESFVPKEIIHGY